MKDQVGKFWHDTIEPMGQIKGDSKWSEKTPSTSNDDTYECDNNGRRMRGKLAGASDWTNIVHDEPSENLICESTFVSGTFAIKALNTYGVGPIGTNRDGTKRDFHFDGLGSTRALTNAFEVVQDTYEYSAFGITEASTGSSVKAHRFCGQWGCDGAFVEVPTPTHPTPLEPRNTDDPTSPMVIGSKPTSEARRSAPEPEAMRQWSAQIRSVGPWRAVSQHRFCAGKPRRCIRGLHIQQLYMGSKLIQP